MNWIRSRGSSLATLAVLLGLVAFASPSLAGGLNLSWDDCGSFGVVQKNFACNTNAGFNLLYISAIPNVAMDLNGHEATVTVSTPSATLPSWWQRQTGGCRAPAPFAQADFSAGPFNCVDPWSAQAAAGQVFDYPVSGYGPDVGRVRTLSVLPAGTFTPVNNTQELYIVRLVMNHLKSTGTGACAGCTQSACIVLQSVKLNGPSGVPSYTISNPALRQHVFWQDAALLAGCPGATPTRNHTWGSVKSLYR